MNRCYCNPGWGGPDCSMAVPITTQATTTAEVVATQSHNMEKIEKTYGNYAVVSSIILNIEIFYIIYSIDRSLYNLDYFLKQF